MSRVFDELANRWPRFAPIAVPLAWTLIWSAAICLAALVHLAFLAAWPDHFIHEDSANYLSEAQSILTGHYADDPGRRPYGVAFFLVLLSKLFAPNILVFVIAQHVLSILSALLIAAAVRFSAAPRIFSVLTFLLASLYARTVHYDNMVGAETISVFLMSAAAFIASGVVFRKWPPLLSAVGIGLSLGAVMLCRSASIGAAVVILAWMAILLDTNWIRRLAVPALAGCIATVVYLTPAAVNWSMGKHTSSNEATAVMEFMVGYSGDFEHGVHLDRKAQARQFVNKMRAAYGSMGWANSGVAQWPFTVTELMRKLNESDVDIGMVVRDIFIETLTTPSTLWSHVRRHFVPEMYFLLFDASIPARHVSSPQGYEFFVKRDTFPLFHTPTGLKPGALILDYYSAPKEQPSWLSWLLPSADQLQSKLDKIMTYGYLPRSDAAPLCCGLTISTEYDFQGGPILWLSVAMVTLVIVLLVGEVAARTGRFPPLPRNLVAGSSLMILLALINAAFPAFLVYALNRYAYYVAPFLAGTVGLLGAVLFERIKVLLWANRRTAARPNYSET
jgi:hypothetical protein